MSTWLVEGKLGLANEQQLGPKKWEVRAFFFGGRRNNPYQIGPPSGPVPELNLTLPGTPHDLFMSAATGKQFPHMTLMVYTKAGGAPVMTYGLKDAVVTSARVLGKTSEFSLSCSTVSVTSHLGSLPA